MAVPIPVNAKGSKGIHPRPAEQDLRLEYHGKKPVKEILATPPGLYLPNASYSGGDNRLYHGDNLGVLAALAQDESVAGNVKLVYIDPPYDLDLQITSCTIETLEKDHLILPGAVVFVEESSASDELSIPSPKFQKISSRQFGSARLIQFAVLS